MEDTEMPNDPKRKAPNVMITGTPGVGKSRICKQLSEMTGLEWIEISKLAIEYNCLEEYDEEYQCPVLDEDKLMDGLEENMCVGGNIVDYHSCDFFPERWFDVVFVLRTNNTILYDRLVNRGYQGKKLEGNMDCEIAQTILEDARASYNPEIVHELQNNTEADFESNVQMICMWLKEWFENQESEN